MPKISIIVPIYNVQNYIDKCLKSIQNQTFTDYEVILVDDGSTDESVKILNKYLNDERFKLYQKENGGLSSARNYGMKFISENSEYISFIDSDDYIELNMLEKMYELAKKDNSDIVECDFIWEYPKKKVIDKSIINDKNLLTDIRVMACNKIYKKIFIDNLKIEFTNGMRYEDVEWCYKILPYVKVFSTLHEPMYHYVQRNTSIANTQNEKVRDIFKSLQGILNYYEEQGIYSIYEAQLEYLVTRIILGSSFLRIIQIKDKKQRNNILLENWNFLNDRFPNWKNNTILKSRTNGKNIYYKLLNRKRYFLASKIFRIIRR